MSKRKLFPDDYAIIQTTVLYLRRLPLSPEFRKKSCWIEFVPVPYLPKSHIYRNINNHAINLTCNKRPSASAFCFSILSRNCFCSASSCFAKFSAMRFALVAEGEIADSPTDVDSILLVLLNEFASFLDPRQDSTAFTNSACSCASSS
jgi:hypothetical protein